MSNDVTFQAEYAGYIGEEKVAYAYKAYAENHKPYVIVANLPDGHSLTIAQLPDLLLDEELDPVQDEENLRENAIAWVDHLTHLTYKARQYDEIFDSVEQAEVESNGEFVTSTSDLTLLSPEDAGDDVWEDEDGDYYRLSDGQWYYSNADGDLFGIVCSDSSLLTAYGPYERHVEPDDDDEPDPRSPYVVDSLGNAEADCEWVDNEGDHYKLIDGVWNIGDGRDDGWSVLDIPSYLTDYGPYRAVQE